MRTLEIEKAKKCEVDKEKWRNKRKENTEL